VRVGLAEVGRRHVGPAKAPGGLREDDDDVQTSVKEAV
jgi:hypothetical protein